jgi:DNA-binding GntR family transcriptional regulator
MAVPELQRLGGSVIAERSAAQVAYEILKERIVTAEVRPGTALSDVQVARELGLGRMPVRDALQRLAAERLVNIFPSRGVFVSELPAFELQQIFEVRIELEGLGARLAAERATPADDLLFAELQSREEAVRIGQQRDGIISLDRDIHRAIVSTARNEYLGRTLDPLRNISTRAWYLTFERYGHLLEMCMEHQAIIEAIRLRNPSAAEAAMRRHIRNYADAVASLF